jgi:hypothetical protein
VTTGELLRRAADLGLAGVRFARIAWAIKNRKLAAPVKDGAGRFDWLPADVDALRAALARDGRRRGQRRQTVGS